jgi:hypothetical protein
MAGETAEVSEPPALFAPFEDFVLESELEEGGLRLIRRDNGEALSVVPVRAFPLTAPEHAICLLDERGHEVSCIEQLAELAADSRGRVEAALALREFRPRLLEIERIDVKSTHSEWHVTTDRGACVFHVEDEEQIRSLDEHRLVIVDQGGTRYLADDLRALSPQSRKRLSRFV